jgi:signal transduction histidine kinase
MKAETAPSEGVQRSHRKRYAASLLLVLGAVLLEYAVTPLFHGRAPLALFIIAVTLAAVYGGGAPGILATVLSVACAELLFGNSIVSLVTGQPSVWLFSAVGIGVSIVIESFQKRNRSLAEAKALLERLNKELAERSQELTQSNEELKRFAYALSHDLKNPLRQVSLFTDLLAVKLGDMLDADTRQALRFIYEGSCQAQEMIRRLLQYSVAEHEARTEKATDLNSVLAAALQDIAMELEKSGGRVTHEQLPTIPADGDRLRQVFANLMGNAIKYRGGQPPEIHVAARRASNEWIVSVRDNGIGIHQRYAEKIFGLFERLHRSSDYEGTGIGLAICRAIIQRHRGRIWVESEPGRGSTFYFSLPSGKVDASRA